MKRVIIAILLASALVLLLGVGGCPPRIEQDQNTIGQKVATAISGPPVDLSGNVIYMNADGFFPKTLIIQPGENVTFYNNDTKNHWPASGIHPTHNAYPESGGCIGSTFDACKEIKPGEAFIFEFKFSGDWKYHDHLNPTTYSYGTITVNSL